MSKAAVPSFSHPVTIAALHGGAHVRLIPTEAERKGMAKFARLHAIDAYEALLDVAVSANGVVTITGAFKAKVHPVCVVTLEPFEQKIDEAIEARYAPLAIIEKLTKRAEENENDDFEPPEELHDGVLDLGALAAEFLVLALDPYPRKDGAEFAGFGEDDEPVSAFDALKALKLKSEG